MTSGPVNGPHRARITPATRLTLCLMMLSIVAVWGWTFHLMKGAIADYGVVPFLAVRFVIGSVSMLIISRGRLTKGGLKVGGAIGGALAVAYLLQTYGLRYSTVTNTGLITGFFIVFAPLFNRLLFGVRTAPTLWLVCGAGVIGLGLLTGAGTTPPAPGDALTLGCAVCFGLHIALLDRYSRNHDATSLALGQLSAAALAFLAAWLVLLARRPEEHPIMWPTGEVWFALIITGVIASAAAFFVQTYVQQRLSAVETAVIIVTEPIFAAIFGYFLAGDILTGWQMLGGCIMIAALSYGEIRPLLTNRRKARASGPDAGSS